MFVKDQMTPDPITVTPDIPIIEAQQKMQRHNIRHLPVVDQGNHVVGLLTRETMLQAVPWSHSALSTLETQYILSKIKAGKVMIQDVITITEDVAVEEAARIIAGKGANAVLIKGGHLVGEAVDLLFSDGKIRRYSAPRFETRHTQGTGCTYSACITAELAKGRSLEDAVDVAKRFITRAIATNPGLGAGSGPVNHHANIDE